MFRLCLVPVTDHSSAQSEDLAAIAERKYSQLIFNGNLTQIDGYERFALALPGIAGLRCIRITWMYLLII